MGSNGTFKYVGARGSGSKAWEPCKIYASAKIGFNVNIGNFSEIGENVIIGDNVRIGSMCFIPECVEIERNAWVGPHCVFTNDPYPPSGRENWKKTKVCTGARLGAHVTVLPGVTIGEHALIGAGATVTKNVPAGETWVGVPAHKIEREA